MAELTHPEKERRKRERTRRAEMREAEAAVVCRAIIWYDFHNPDLPEHVPELQDKAAKELIGACAQARHLTWRHRRERIKCGDA